MKVKHFIAVGAYKALVDLGNKDMPAKISYSLYKIKNKLKPIWEFQIEQEKKLLDKYGAENEEGRKVITNKEGLAALETLMRDMAEVDEEIDIEKPTIHMPEDINMTVDQFDILSNFIIFDE